MCRVASQISRRLPIQAGTRTRYSQSEAVRATRTAAHLTSAFLPCDLVEFAVMWATLRRNPVLALFGAIVVEPYATRLWRTTAFWRSFELGRTTPFLAPPQDRAPNYAFPVRRPGCRFVNVSAQHVLDSLYAVAQHVDGNPNIADLSQDDGEGSADAGTRRPTCVMSVSRARGVGF